jgi:protein O-GlcNAc transferase
VRRELAAGKLPPVQPFHTMAYPTGADLALAISRKCADHCLAAAARCLGCCGGTCMRCPHSAARRCCRIVAGGGTCRAAAPAARGGGHMPRLPARGVHPACAPHAASWARASCRTRTPPRCAPASTCAYVSGDFGNHPLSHLLGSVFGLPDRSKVSGPCKMCYCYCCCCCCPWPTATQQARGHRSQFWAAD